MFAGNAVEAGLWLNQLPVRNARSEDEVRCGPCAGALRIHLMEQLGCRAQSSTVNMTVLLDYQLLAAALVRVVLNTWYLLTNIITNDTERCVHFSPPTQNTGVEAILAPPIYKGVNFPGCTC